MINEIKEFKHNIGVDSLVIKESKYESLISDLDKVTGFNYVVSFDPIDNAEVYEVKTQEEFDLLNERINNSFAENKNVIVELYDGIYKFNDSNVIEIKDIDKTDLSLIIRNAPGNNDVVVMADGHTYVKSDAIGYTSSHWIAQANGYDKHNSNILADLGKKNLICNSFNKFGVTYADGEIETLDAETWNFRLKLPASMADISYTEEECANAFVWFDTSYFGNLADIVKIEGGYLYFKLIHDMFLDHYSINTSYGFGKKYARFNIFNLPFVLTEETVLVKDNLIYVPYVYDYIVDCKYGSFLKYTNSTLKELRVSGINFCGSKFVTDLRRRHYLHSAEGGSSLIAVQNSKNIIITNNKFIGVGGDTVILACESENELYSNNEFINILQNGITTNGTNVDVNHNTFKDSSLWIPSNNNCIRAFGINNHVHNNQIYDYCYGAISCGTFALYGNPNCVIENNIAVYTDNFIKNYELYTLMDGGALYTSPSNNGTIIRNNIVVGYRGMYNNSGIYCDDGTYHVSIYRNILTGGNMTWAINARYVNGDTEHNTGILIAYNIFDNAYLLEGEKVDNNQMYSFGNTMINISEDKNLLRFVNKDDNYFISYKGYAFDVLNYWIKQYEVIGLDSVILSWQRKF